MTIFHINSKGCTAGLPITYRVQSKICLIVIKTLHGLSRQYIKDLLTLKVRTRTLRQQKLLELYEPQAKISSVGGRSFSVAGLSLCNSLPNDVKSAQNFASFKQLLKSYFFTLNFN